MTVSGKSRDISKRIRLWQLLLRLKIKRLRATALEDTKRGDMIEGERWDLGEKLKWKQAHRIWEMHLNLRTKLALQGEPLFIFWVDASLLKPLWLWPSFIGEHGHPPSPLSWASRLRCRDDALDHSAIAWGCHCSHFKTGRIVRCESCKKRFFSQRQRFWWEM